MIFYRSALGIVLLVLSPQFAGGQRSSVLELPFNVLPGAPVQRIVLELNGKVHPIFDDKKFMGLGVDPTADEKTIVEAGRLKELLVQLEAQPGSVVRPVFPAALVGNYDCIVASPDSFVEIFFARSDKSRETLEEMVLILRKLPAAIETISVEPFAEPSAPKLPQPYLGPFPGINQAAGSGVFLGDPRMQVASVECDIQDNHIDLPKISSQGSRSGLRSDKSHGAAVMGIMAAGDNNKIIRGIVPDAKFWFVAASCKNGGSQDPYNLETALTIAAGKVRSGGVIVVPLQLTDVELDSSCPNPNCTILPIELLPTVGQVIKKMSECGKHVVVLASGNGSCDLNKVRLRAASVPYCRPVFDKNYFDSGAIFVGAGVQDDSSRTTESNYGARVDLHAWGERISTLGYGNGIVAPSQAYTTDFGGTSGAAAIVAGVAANLQSKLLATSKPTLDPKALRGIMVRCGYDGGNKEIGALPNLQKTLQYLAGGPCP